VLDDPRVPSELLQRFITHAVEVFVYLQQRYDVIVPAGAFPARGGCDPRIRPQGHCSQSR
jgi:hypothetical protein